MRAFGAPLGDHEACFYGFSQTNLVGEDATAFAKTPQRKDNRIYLVWIGINTGLPLRSGVSLPVIRPTNSEEVFSENTLVERTHINVAEPNQCILRCPLKLGRRDIRIFSRLSGRDDNEDLGGPSGDRIKKGRETACWPIGISQMSSK